MRARRVMAVLVSLGVAAAALAATSPSSVGASAPRQPFPKVDQPGVSDTEIHVGGVVSKTNPIGVDNAAAFDGAQAYFNMVNSSKDKGIYGRKLKLVSKRDDQVVMNSQEVIGLISEDNVFAALPVSVFLFTGANLLAEAGMPTFGWNVNVEWGSEQAPGPPNLFGEKGSFLCFTCQNALLPLFAKEVKVKKVGVIAYQIPQSSDCADGNRASFEKYPSAKIAFFDSSIPFGGTNFSTDVLRMKDAGVDLVTSCLDNNGTLTLAKEMKKQGLHAIQYLPQAYNQKFVQDNASFLQGAYVLTYFTPFEVKDKPKGLSDFQKWMKKGGFDQNENSMAGWINADLFVNGLRAAGPDFTRQKVIDAINSMKDYRAGGLLAGIDWTIAHSGDGATGCVVLSKVDNGKFVPQFGQPGKPFACYPNHPDTLPAKFVPQAGVTG